MDEKGLGARLQAARLRAGLTQQSLCQRAGLSYSTLTKIERGAIKSPSIFTIQSITDALGVSLNELMGTPPNGTSKQKRRSKSGVSFIYFDVHGCLVHFFQRAFTLLAAETGVPADEIETVFWRYNDQACRGDMTMQQFNQALAHDLKLPPVQWVDYYLRAIEPIPVMQDLVRWASETYSVGLLTNTMPGFVDALREHKLLPDVPYDVIIDSSAVKAIKPEAKMYDLAVKRAGVEPHEILLIDDSRPNLMAADKHGWHVLWFDDYRPEEAAERVRATLEPAD